VMIILCERQTGRSATCNIATGVGLAVLGLGVKTLVCDADLKMLYAGI
jgi:hypothetical protein